MWLVLFAVSQVVVPFTRVMGDVMDEGHGGGESGREVIPRLIISRVDGGNVSIPPFAFCSSTGRSRSVRQDQIWRSASRGAII